MSVDTKNLQVFHTSLLNTGSFDYLFKQDILLNAQESIYQVLETLKLDEYAQFLFAGIKKQESRGIEKYFTHIVDLEKKSNIIIPEDIYIHYLSCTELTKKENKPMIKKALEGIADNHDARLQVFENQIKHMGSLKYTDNLIEKFDNLIDFFSVEGEASYKIIHKYVSTLDYFLEYEIVDTISKRAFGDGEQTGDQTQKVILLQLENTCTSTYSSRLYPYNIFDGIKYMIQRIEENHFTKEKLKDILQSAFTAIQEDVTNRRRIEDGKTDMNSVSILEKGFKVLGEKISPKMYAYLIVHSYPFDQRKTKINDLYNGEYYNEQEKEKLFIELVAFSGGETVFTSLLAIVAEIFGNDQNKLFRLLDIYFNRADAKLLEELFKFLDKIKDHDFYNEAVKQKITLFANSTLEKADISDLGLLEGYRQLCSYASIESVTIYLKTLIGLIYSMDNTESIQHYIYRVKQCIVASINTQKAFHELIQYVFSSQKETSSERRYRLFRSLIETKLYPKICFEAITALLQDVSTIEDINLVEELVNCIQATEIQDDITKTKIDLFLLRIMNDDEQPQARSNALQHIQKFAEDHNLVTEHGACIIEYMLGQSIKTNEGSVDLKAIQQVRIEYISEVVEIANARNITLTSDQITRHMDKLKKTQESQSQQIAEKKVVDIKRTETEEQLTSNQGEIQIKFNLSTPEVQQKYILVLREDTKTLHLVSNPSDYHVQLFSGYVSQEAGNNLSVTEQSIVLGGGIMKINHNEKKIVLHGGSGSYGCVSEKLHSFMEKILTESYQGYSISIQKEYIRGSRFDKVD